jgi:type VI secretion system protein ImpE
MNAKDLVAAGKLTEARKQLTQEVKSKPSDSAKRTLLFQVLSFLGEWDKADKHLEMMVSLNPDLETGAQVYKNLTHAERQRKEVLEGKAIPGFLTKAPSYFGLYLEAWDRVRQGQPEEAANLYGQIEELRPMPCGTIDGKPFEGFTDTDTFLSAFLEVIMHDRYVWIPFESLRELSVNEPKTLFDLMWVPARFLTWEGLNANCYLPVLYPDSCLHEDERVKMGRMTDWVPLGSGFWRGVGQHVYRIGDDELSILDIREAVFALPGKDDQR